MENIMNMIDYLRALFFSNKPAKNEVELDGDDMEEQEISSDKLVHLYREYHENGTHGWWVFPNGETILTVERPWLENQNYVSCVPEDIYPLVYRESAVVKRTSKGKYTHGWQIDDVPNRTWIMAHIGNWPLTNSDGCVLTGTTHDFDKGQPVVWNSAIGFDRFMELMDKYKPTHISIEEKSKEV